jgi:hypothetical protein
MSSEGASSGEFSGIIWLAVNDNSQGRGGGCTAGVVSITDQDWRVSERATQIEIRRKALTQARF